MTRLLTTLVTLVLCLTASAQSSVENQCELTTWGVYRYNNLTLIDSVEVIQGRCNSTAFYAIDGLYAQYVWGSNLLTVYQEAQVVTLAPVSHAIPEAEKGKLKRRNIPPDSTMQVLHHWGFDSVTNYKTSVAESTRLTMFQVGDIKYTYKTELQSGKILEIIESYNNVEIGSDQVNRKVTRLIKTTTDRELLEPIIDPKQVLQLDTKQLTSNYLKQGFNLYQL